MDHILSFSIFETNNPHTIKIINSIDDTFYEFEDEYGFKCDIPTDDEYIHEVVGSTSVLYGRNFIYPSESEKRWNMLPGQYNKDWKLGFIISISKPNEAYEGELWEIEHNRLMARGRANKVVLKRKLSSYKKRLDEDRLKVDNFIKRKIRLIKRRVPDEIFLLGVKSVGSSAEYKYEFAFIYNEYK